MSDTVENGRSGGASPWLPDESHDEFLELCALSTTELLSARERLRLEDHLGGCFACRVVHAQYQALVHSGIPSAVCCGEGGPITDSASEWSVDEAEAELFARLDREPERTGQAAGAQNVVTSPECPVPFGERGGPVDELWRQMWWQYAALILLAFALGVSLYRVGTRKGAEITASAPPATSVAAPRARESNNGRERPSVPEVPASTSSEQAELPALRAQLDGKAVEVTRLENERTLLDQTLRQNRSDRDQLEQKADLLSQKLAASEADLTAAREQLAAMGNQNSQDTARLALA